MSFWGGVRGRVVNTSNSGSGGPGFKPRPSRCTFRQGTLLHLVSLHGYRRQTAGGTSAMDQEGKAILLGMLHALLQEYFGISSVRLGLWLVCAFTITFWVFGLNHLMWPIKLPSSPILSRGTIYLFCVYSMIGLPEETLSIAFLWSILTFRYWGYFFQREKKYFFSGGNFCFIKGMSMLFSQSKQTNQQK